VDCKGAGEAGGIRYVFFRGSLQECGDVSTVGSSHDPPARIDASPEKAGSDLVDIRVMAKASCLHWFHVLSGTWGAWALVIEIQMKVQFSPKGLLSVGISS